MFVAAAGAAMLIGLREPPTVSAQSATTDWEKAAGGKMAFDVASVKQNNSGLPPVGDNPTANFPLDDGDAYTSDRGYLSVKNFPASVYISFAYKLHPAEGPALLAQLPKWAREERFDLDARAPATSTKDQMRLMMQSILADRFKLATHWESHDGPVYELVLAKEGKRGPQLHSYAEDPPCAATSDAPNAASSAPPLKLNVGEFPPECFAVAAQPNSSGVWTIGSRNLSMQQLGNDLSAIPGSNLDRPVVDRTGLSGNFDFLVQITVKRPGSPDTQADDSGPTFLEVLSDQLGLKLKPATGATAKLVIDHIEEPSPN